MAETQFALQKLCCVLCRLQHGNLVASDMCCSLSQRSAAVGTVLFSIHVLRCIPGAKSQGASGAKLVPFQANPHTRRNLWPAPSCGAVVANVRVHI
jgi:hypothetical protein